MITQPFHLHGVVPSDRTKKTAAPTHSLLDCGPIRAVVSPYDLQNAAGLSEEDATEKLALQHHAVLMAYAAEGAVLPIRLGSVFSSDSALQISLADQLTQYQAALHKLADLREYVIRLDRGAASPQSNTAPATGRAFLTSKRRARDARHGLSRACADFATRLQTEVAVFAEHLSPEPLRKDRLLHLAGLFHHEQINTLQTRIDVLQHDATALGVHLSMTGPWPPYSYDPFKGLTQPVLHDA